MIKTEWDYSELASFYDKRADYAQDSIKMIADRVGLNKETLVCDIGAGTGKLTIQLAKYGSQIYAIEPNDNMRKYGVNNTLNINNVKWFEGTGEHTGMTENTFDLVTFGSSFNVCNRILALEESFRILKHGGIFVCLWNHRVLDNPIQKDIESILRKNIQGYSHGVRRENQRSIIENSGLFEDITESTYEFNVIKSKMEFAEAWYSDATVKRQSGEQFTTICEQIKSYLDSINYDKINIPYTTKVWIAKKKG